MRGALRAWLLTSFPPLRLLALRALLEDLGALIHCARSGEEALRQVLKHRYAAIVLDVYMPGIDGVETAAAIRSVERLRVPILFVSEHADRRAKGRARDPLLRISPEADRCRRPAPPRRGSPGLLRSSAASGFRLLHVGA